MPGILSILPSTPAPARDDGSPTALDQGLIYACYPWTVILAPVSGVVTKLGQLHLGDASQRYVQITDDRGLQHRVYYIAPSVLPGESVYEGITPIGMAQDMRRSSLLAGQWLREQRNHIRYAVWDGSQFLHPLMLGHLSPEPKSP